jgi:hypothetical protein
MALCCKKKGWAKPKKGGGDLMMEKVEGREQREVLIKDEDSLIR